MLALWVKSDINCTHGEGVVCAYSTFPPTLFLACHITVYSDTHQVCSLVSPHCRCAFPGPLSLLHKILMLSRAAADIFIELFTRENNDSRVPVRNK